MPLNRRLALGFAAASVLPAIATRAAAAQPLAFPQRPVRIIVGSGAGTGPDIVARVLAQKLSEAWNHTGVIVENKAGAGGLVAASEAARATPDGHTLMLGLTVQLSIAPHIYRKLAYDPARDFAPITQVATSDFALLVNPQKVPAKNLRDYIDWARQHKDLFLATFGAGTVGHFGAFLFCDAIGVRAEAVHYKGTSEALAGLVSGDVHGVFASSGLAATLVRSGKLAALATSDALRSPALPDIPTFKEQGHPNLVFNSWFGMVAPTRTPPELVSRLQADIVRELQAPDGRRKIEDAGFRATGTSPADFATIIDADSRTWGKAVLATGFKAD